MNDGHLHPECLYSMLFDDMSLCFSRQVGKWRRAHSCGIFRYEPRLASSGARLLGNFLEGNYSTVETSLQEK